MYLAAIHYAISQTNKNTIEIDEIYIIDYYFIGRDTRVLTRLA